MQTRREDNNKRPNNIRPTYNQAVARYDISNYKKGGPLLNSAFYYVPAEMPLNFAVRHGWMSNRQIYTLILFFIELIVMMFGGAITVKYFGGLGANVMLFIWITIVLMTISTSMALAWKESKFVFLHYCSNIWSNSYLDHCFFGSHIQELYSSLALVDYKLS